MDPTGLDPDPQHCAKLYDISALGQGNNCPESMPIKNMHVYN
jgi:hypothetical protein